MKMIAYAAGLMLGLGSLIAGGQPPQPPDGQPDRPQDPGGPGPMRGPGGFGGGPNAQERKLVKQFDKDKDGRLNAEERKTARAYLKNDTSNRRRGPGGGGPGGGGPGGAGGPGGPGGFGGREEPASPGPKVSPGEVATYPKTGLYDQRVLRTIFLDFEDTDWEAAMADFYNTDVEVPATMTVDGVKYPGVGIHFRGASSYFTVPAGSKRSLNVSLDFTDEKQRLDGVRTLNLLNSHGDPSFLSTVLFSRLARDHMPAPRANLVRVVINGESWGVYVNVEQFNKDFVAQNFKGAKGDGARWKVKGSPGGDSGLNYVGDNIEEYKRRYQIKSGDRDEDWRALIELCRVLSETPLDQLEAALKPILDIDGALWFLAYDIATINSDGYWVRASDYSLYRDPKGVFHIVPHDMNEAFMGAMGGPGGGGMGPGRGRPGGGPGGQGGQGPPPGGGGGGGGGPTDQPPDPQVAPNQPLGPGPGGPGMARGPRGNPFELDPLTGMDDTRKPLRSRLLAVPSLRAKYLDHVRAIGRELAWDRLGPMVAEYRTLIGEQIKADTKKSSSAADFERATADAPAAPQQPQQGRGRPATSLRAFADARSKYLVGYVETPRKDPAANPGGERPPAERDR